MPDDKYILTLTVKSNDHIEDLLVFIVDTQNTPFPTELLSVCVIVGPAKVSHIRFQSSAAK